MLATPHAFTNRTASGLRAVGIRSKNIEAKRPVNSEFFVIEIGLLTFREAVHEYDLQFRPERDDRPLVVRATLAGTRDSLFDDSTAQISIEQTDHSPFRPQLVVRK